jgi:hypothetical protein
MTSSSELHSYCTKPAAATAQSSTAAACLPSLPLSILHETSYLDLVGTSKLNLDIFTISLAASAGDCAHRMGKFASRRRPLAEHRATVGALQFVPAMNLS